jgi:hypothetical protein
MTIVMFLFVLFSVIRKSINLQYTYFSALVLTVFGYFRWLYGTTLMAILFVPFGVYHTMTEPYVVGALWGFMLPVGYVAAASGVAVIIYPRSTLLKKVEFGYLLMLVGVVLLFSLWMFPRELFISLLHGTNMIDVDYSVFNGAVMLLAFFNVGAGLAVKASKILRPTG